MIQSSDTWQDALGPDATDDQIGEWLAEKWISTEPLTEAELAQARRFLERHGLLQDTITP